jgi:hypothetical protein
MDQEQIPCPGDCNQRTYDFCEKVGDDLSVIDRTGGIITYEKICEDEPVIKYLYTIKNNELYKAEIERSDEDGYIVAWGLTRIKVNKKSMESGGSGFNRKKWVYDNDGYEDRWKFQSVKKDLLIYIDRISQEVVTGNMGTIKQRVVTKKLNAFLLSLKNGYMKK